MRRGTLLLVMAVAAVAVLVGAGAVQAQLAPVPVDLPNCADVGPYDHNDDGRLNYLDFEMWVLAVHEGDESCRLDGPASGCPDWVDVNGDGVASWLDLDEMRAFKDWCVTPPKNTLPQPGL